MINFNNSQRLGLDLDRHIALDAGAGTGKTTVMAERYVQHLIAHDQRATHVTPQGPRTPLSGHGALRAPARERTDLEAWPGLLPSEVVAITFTKKAAAELKARIRQRLGQSRATAVAADDAEGVFDPRLRSDADVEMLLSSLDEAPISTIDAFLNRLIQPHIDRVTLYPSHTFVAEAQKPVMLNDALHTVWRIRSVEDAHEAGVLHHHEAFIGARDRLVAMMGGQGPAEVVLNGLMNRSLFVEQSHRAMIQRSEDLGLDWNGRGPVPVAVLLDLIAEPVRNELQGHLSALHADLRDWVDLFLQHHERCVAPAEGDTHLTRFNHLVRMAHGDLPESTGAGLSWAWKLNMALASTSGLAAKPPTFFPRSALPQSDGWPAGLLTKSKASTAGIGKDGRAALYDQAGVLQDRLVRRLHAPLGSLVNLLAKAAFLIEPGDGFDGMPLESPLRLAPLTQPLPNEPPSTGTFVDGELQAQVLSDLIEVHRATHQILARRKSLDGLHDFDDLQRFAADVLLARCPDVCRHRYPPEVIDALDGLGDEPWSDHHITRALTLLNDRPELQADLHQRVAVLGDIRRQFRAFIIDEYQDTNPAHFRLLARLWGRRHQRADDPQRPRGAWDPTVCIVGDMKQSIYRFRQAEVSVMRRAVAMIRRCNIDEADDARLDHLRQDGHGRDPRPVGAGGEGGSFSNEHETRASAPHSFVPLNQEDGDEGAILDDERLQRRREGHIDLASNHRTRADLMETMNDMFDEVFDPHHHDLPGDWHAEPQRLRPARMTDEGGVFEWLLPVQGTLDTVPESLDEPLDTFSDPHAAAVHLEHELVAQRLASLIGGGATRVWDADRVSWTDVTEVGSEVRPSDVMILVNSRRHLPDLVRRLRERGLPVMADRLGLLMTQPVVQPLQALLTLMAHPTSRLAAFQLARSPVMGMSEDEVHACLSGLGDGEDAWSHLIAHAPTPGTQALMVHLWQRASAGALYEVFEDVLDHSDLLAAYPGDADRQFAEAWYAMLHDIGAQHGHDVGAVQANMAGLRQLGQQGPKAISPAATEALQIMTIHGSKGLQSPVVVVTGLFTAGKADATVSIQDNVLVTPQAVAGRVQPWLGAQRPQDGLWAFASEMNKAQDKAELRRKFYVALTRVKDRLVVSGAPGDRSEWDETNGRLAVNVKPDPRTMGSMLMQGLRRAAWLANTAHPLLVETEALEADELPPFSPRRETIAFNPASMLSTAALGPTGVQGLRVYHHPACFNQPTPSSPQAQLRELADRFASAAPSEPAGPRSPPPTVAVMKGAAHHLDTTSTCPRRYWLEHVKGWPTEPLWLPGRPRPPVHQRGWPEATTFGLMMHRLLEIGLRNPCSIHATSSPLSRDWLHAGEDRLTDDEALGEVMHEFGFGTKQAEGSDEATWRARLTHLSSLVQRGRLGRMLNGETMDGLRVEAVRTELPFFHRHGLPVEHRNTAAFTSPLHVTSVTMDFSGRADLVLALTDGSGPGYLRVVDLKTTGCLGGFNPSTPAAGHPLQACGPETVDLSPQNEAEADLLMKHRLQLSLYSLALEAMERNKPEAQRRTVLPPAVLVGANGRTVALDDAQFERAKSDLDAHLVWRAHVHLNAATEAPHRLPMAAGACESCPYHRGHVRRCGPEGEPLGVGPFTSDP